ncbi:MAG: Gfo/Idh/MocA family oxidoreductase [Bacteroidaceae bacterium]|nr:Gfo/Idh/MocA family oxidoreductase [Bacteroidaceae bacterium]
MIQRLTEWYKRIRTERFLAQTYQYSYVFVGMGQHSRTNLYPVLHYLGVPLRCICVTSERRAGLIAEKFGVKATTSLDGILSDASVRGVFVSASPAAHFSIASRVLESGKSLFVEKPPCRNLDELDALIALRRRCGVPVAMVGLQGRYAPAVKILRKRLAAERLLSYDLHYLTGAYPEGNALLELFIHPLDLVVFLFGKPEIVACERVSKGNTQRSGESLILVLRHPPAVGTLELSTAYTWTAAEASLRVCTSRGVYRLSQMDSLTFEPHHPLVLGVPLEKVWHRPRTVEHLFAPEGFASTLRGNRVYTQGYYGELSAFVDAVEGVPGHVETDLTAMRTVYELIRACSVPRQPTPCRC